MIIMDLKIDNFFAFRNFDMNMSYPKKIVNSYISGEYLKDRENFRYKKINILMGGNATGKTSIGKMLMSIFNFIERKEYMKLKEQICDKNKVALFQMDFVVNSYKLYRISTRIFPTDSENTDVKIEVFSGNVDIEKRDSYESCAKRLNEIPVTYTDDFISELEKIENLGWMFSYPADFSSGVVACADNPYFPKVLDYTLRALDPSIIKVEKLSKVENTYVIRMSSQDLVIQDGQVIKSNMLSSGTKAGIDVACMLSSMYAGEYGFYYCDEKFSYIHSEVEKAFLNAMIDGLKDNEQLFFTTHNLDIADIPLPKHSFHLLKKDVNNEEEPIKCICVSEFLKRSTDSVRNAIDNDLFSAEPNVELIYELSELKDKVSAYEGTI